MKLRNVLQLIVPNISILNALKSTISKNISSILMLIPYISDVHCIIVIFVESVETLCQFSNASDVLRLYISGVWTRIKC